ncbi:phage N-6-adenine-methyltransferase [Bowmanella sp. JS7-9]|uniref:Phage N-6-adenine-methyltransferase n=1 Tax=Pseudobowmanella zhangzhouensis TaxID=1537679 RepID=A0ABW1XLP4_9ALTE|nr:phage N-6-adenine-methyltransferase [Bowmanella sp. JS7-9]TBX21953.1 hypothetical protein TK45_10745 [Bowmanella sp. JS7-9]
MTDYLGSNTALELRDSYGTPQWLFNAANDEFFFDLDAAANDENHKVDKYLTKEVDALSISWVNDIGAKRIWINPPYSDIGPWTEKALIESELGATIVMLIPATPDVRWWPKRVSEIRFISPGRINFIDPATGLEKKGNTKPSAFLIWRPYLNDQTFTRYVPKTQLQRLGGYKK